MESGSYIFNVLFYKKYSIERDNISIHGQT